jgi:uncharacterized repeat protein (TIGR03803 family)
MLRWRDAMMRIRFSTAVALTQTLLCVLLLTAVSPAQAQTEKVVYPFSIHNADGQGPQAGLILDKAGNFYGTTFGGGPFGWGTVFEITSAGEEKVLYAFGGKNPEGMHPNASLVFDKVGNLYGTTLLGGTNNAGTVFEISAAGTEEVLYSFGSRSGDGETPYAGLVFDKKGNLYGTTSGGGAHSAGTVFEITTGGAEKVIYSFGSHTLDGSYPYYAGLVLGKAGRFYGTTYAGGAHGLGTVFQVNESGKEKVLYSFGGQPGDGWKPYATVVLDKTGNLYGTTLLGGAFGEGTVFEMTSTGEEKLLYSFGSQSGDGNEPTASLILDTPGNLYGTTSQGGLYGVQTGGYGTVFEITTAGTEKVLYEFGAQSGDGNYPIAGLVFDEKGNLYGTTKAGGSSGLGTVFEGTP